MIDIPVDAKCEIMLSYHNKSQHHYKNVTMLIEIPDIQTILGVIVAFFVGIFGVIIYNKVRFLSAQKEDPSYLSRLEYYERQLIDMKIRLDALDLEENEPEEPILEKLSSPVEKTEEQQAKKDVSEPKKEVEKLTKQPRMPNMGFNGIAEHVLGLITTKEMTSRDIQITIGRSREHTSRLMKRLYEDGLVERNTKSKPFTYRITDKGRSKIGNTENPIPA